MSDEVKIETNVTGIQNNINIDGTTIEKCILTITPTFVRDINSILSDKIQSWRLKNQINIFEKTKKLCKEKNIPLKAIQLKFLIPFIENSSLEEDESMQNRWASLLCSAIQINDINSNFIDILKQLTAQEAKIIDQLYSESAKKTNVTIQHPISNQPAKIKFTNIEKKA